MRRAVIVLALLLGVSSAVGLAFRRDLRAAERRVDRRSRVIGTSFGRVEYAVKGRGPPLLMIHGTGGGFDQGLTFSEGLLPYHRQIIAPSRFGYLQSTLPSDPSSERQADALVELLDHLRIDKLPVAGGSAGALSAVQFALRHPERTSALILIVPAANVRGTDPVRMGAVQEFLVRRLMASDFLFWAGIKAAHNQMTGTLLATDPELLGEASLRERQRAERILSEILPVSRRWRGMLNDAKLAGSPAGVDFTKIRVPTLILSAQDDRFGTSVTAADIAKAVPRSKLVLYPSGGHIWVGHDGDVWREVANFLANLPQSSPH